MVLAAGKGTRLRPLTDVLPKPLCEVAGVPLIRLTLRQLRGAGITRAVINLHHLGDAIRAHLGGHAEGVELQYSPEDVILGTGGGIAMALPLLGESPFVVANADALQDVDVGALLEAHQASGALATLALREDPDVLKYGPVGVDDGLRIRRLVDVFDDGKATRLLMFTGVHVMHPSAVAHLPRGVESCVIRQGYAHHLTLGKQLRGFVHTGAFHDVGTPLRWAGAQARVLTGQDALLRSRALGSAGAVDGIQVLAGAQVAPGACLVGPCVVQPGARVEDGATVGPHAALGRDVVVEAGATVRRAAVLQGVTVPARTTLEEGVWGRGVKLAWPYPP
jgi:mannose-1-phosphate guanylyltransferase